MYVTMELDDVLKCFPHLHNSFIGLLTELNVSFVGRLNAIISALDSGGLVLNPYRE